MTETEIARSAVSANEIELLASEWAKADASEQERIRAISRTAGTLRRMLEQLAIHRATRPVVAQ